MRVAFQCLVQDTRRLVLWGMCKKEGSYCEGRGRMKTVFCPKCNNDLEPTKNNKNYFMCYRCIKGWTFEELKTIEAIVVIRAIGELEANHKKAKGLLIDRLLKIEEELKDYASI